MIYEYRKIPSWLSEQFFECRGCYALVHNREDHDKWHAEQNSLDASRPVPLISQDKIKEWQESRRIKPESAVSAVSPHLMARIKEFQEQREENIRLLQQEAREEKK